MFLFIATALIAIRVRMFYLVILFAVLSQLAFVCLESMTFAEVSEDLILKIVVAVFIGCSVFGYKQYLSKKSLDKFLDFKRRSTFVLVLLLCLLGAANAIIVCLGINKGQSLLASDHQRIEALKSTNSTLRPLEQTKEDKGFGISPDPMQFNSESRMPTSAAQRAKENAR